MPKVFTPPLKLTITLLVTILFVAGIEYYIGFDKVLSPWQSLPPDILIAAVLLMLSSYCLRAMRIFSFFHLANSQEFFLCIKTTFLHNFFNNLLPMRSGELSLPLMLKRYFAINTLDAVVALLFFRILDLHVLGLILLTAGFLLYPQLWLLVIFAITIWLSTPFIILKFRLNLENWLASNNEKKFYKMLHKVISSFPNSQAQLVTAYWWTFINWLIKLLVLSWILLQFFSTAAPTNRCRFRLPRSNR